MSELVILERDELHCLGHLANAWNAFSKLPVQHPNDSDEFLRAIHQAQHIVTTRLARRAYPLVLYSSPESSPPEPPTTP